MEWFGKKKKKGVVAVGMSGGVDSSTSAALLVDQGYECFGLFMHYWSDPVGVEGRAPENQCCSVENFEDVRRVCRRLGMPLYTLNFDELFKTEVVDYFLAEYAAGRTPNPCVQCNRLIKFGAFLEKAQTLGADAVATGHYAVVRRPSGGRGSYHLYASPDRDRDQSYFLYNLTQAHLPHVLFPVGGYHKRQVRALARRFALPVAEKGESSGVCFVKEKQHDSFLGRHLALTPGDIVTTSGEVIGTHRGLPLYTVGQRRGIGSGGGPYYVVRSDSATNRLIVTADPRDPALSCQTFTTQNVNWLSGRPLTAPLHCLATVRYHHRAVPAVVTPGASPATVTVRFNTPQRAVTPGQSAVFYARRWRGLELLGGGVIE